jgi:outer membrane protein assembly factor BamB
MRASDGSILALVVMLSIACSASNKSSGTDAGSAGAVGSAAANGGKAGATAVSGSGASPAQDLSASVLERNKNPSRDGHFLQPSLSKANVVNMAKEAAFAASFDGNMWASPLYLENGPNGKGLFFAVTTGNDVFALDETTGRTIWKHNIGASPTANGVGCGNIHPLGILSTPVIDAQTRTLFVAGAIGSSAIARRIQADLRGAQVQLPATEPTQRALDRERHRLRGVRWTRR